MANIQTQMKYLAYHFERLHLFSGKILFISSGHKRESNLYQSLRWLFPQLRLFLPPAKRSRYDAVFIVYRGTFFNHFVTDNLRHRATWLLLFESRLRKLTIVPRDKAKWWLRQRQFYQWIAERLK